MIEPRCKHNWTTPPECPQCCSDERDQLRQQLQADKSHIEELRKKVAGYGGENAKLQKWKGIMEPAMIATVVERDELKAKLEAAQKACAEMRFYAEQADARLCDAGHAAQYDPSWCRPKTMTHDEVKDACIQAYHWIHKILSTDCGKGWVSPEKVRALVTIAEQLFKDCTTAPEVRLRREWDSAKKDL